MKLSMELDYSEKVFYYFKDIIYPTNLDPPIINSVMNEDQFIHAKK